MSRNCLRGCGGCGKGWRRENGEKSAMVFWAIDAPACGHPSTACKLFTNSVDTSRRKIIQKLKILKRYKY